jgi:glycosyltransferase involved in cell wall biosynthesis
VLAGRLGLDITVVGGGPARAHAERVAEELGVEVRWRGALDRASARQELASAAAALLLPDGPEGLGLCLLEAASAGTPVIGRAWGGTPEAVGPGVVLPKDEAVSAVDLTDVLALLDDPMAGQRARDWVESVHHPHACLAALDAVLRAQGGGL